MTTPNNAESLEHKGARIAIRLLTGAEYAGLLAISVATVVAIRYGHVRFSYDRVAGDEN